MHTGAYYFFSLPVHSVTAVDFSSVSAHFLTHGLGVGLALLIAASSKLTALLCWGPSRLQAQGPWVSLILSLKTHIIIIMYLCGPAAFSFVLPSQWVGAMYSHMYKVIGSPSPASWYSENHAPIGRVFQQQQWFSSLNSMLEKTSPREDLSDFSDWEEFCMKFWSI